MGALNGDRVEFTFLARRKNHIKEAQVNKILERAKDSFVGRLKVDKDIAYLVTPGDVFAHNIIIPRRKLKGGKRMTRLSFASSNGLMRKTRVLSAKWLMFSDKRVTMMWR